MENKLLEIEDNKFLEIETKYEADEIDRLQFKALVSGLNPKSFLYIESKDIYYVKSENEFLRFRNPPKFSKDRRAELTFKKKTTQGNNNVRTEVNLRVDMNGPETVDAFCNGLGYIRNFAIDKLCDIYWFDDANVVYYTVVDESGNHDSYIEIEVNEHLNLGETEGWEIITKYEKLFQPLGISPQKRKRLSLFEMYRKEVKQ